MADSSTQDRKSLALKECICKRCPTFVECAQKENIGYCVTGKSKCIKKRSGCICWWCPVHKKLKLEWWYFCIE